MVLGDEDDDPWKAVVHGAAAIVDVTANRLGRLRADCVVEVNEARKPDSPGGAGRVEERERLLHEFLNGCVRGDFGEQKDPNFEPLVAGTRLGFRIEAEGDVLTVDFELSLNSALPLNWNRSSVHLGVDEERSRCAGAFPDLARSGCGEVLVVGDVDRLERGVASRGLRERDDVGLNQAVRRKRNVADSLMKNEKFAERVDAVGSKERLGCIDGGG